MSQFLNPITDAQALAVDGDRYPEKRVQELLDCWLSQRFTGAPIQVHDKSGSEITVTLDQCPVQWGESAAPEGSAGKVILHLFLVDRRNKKQAIRPGVVGELIDWSFQVLVKIDRNLTGAPGTPRPDFRVRKVADDLCWLIGGPEKLALASQGVERMKVASGPSIATTTQWCARMLMLTCSTRRELPRIV